MLMHYWPACSFVIFEGCLGYARVSSPGVVMLAGEAGSPALDGSHEGVDVWAGSRGRLPAPCLVSRRSSCGQRHPGGRICAGRRAGAPLGRWLGPASARHRPSRNTGAGSGPHPAVKVQALPAQ